MQNNIKWFALYTKPRAEFVAETKLNELGVEVYLPKILRVKQWSDRKKKILEPLFKSYIFIRCTEQQRALASYLPQIVKTVCFDGKPAIIPDEQIENIRTLLHKTNDVTVVDGIVEGTAVKIVEGPFAGVTGVVFTKLNDELMLGVSIELLNRTVVVQVSKNSLMKIAS